MKNSLKQMMRTPLRTGLFLVLMVLAALLLTLGSCVWIKSSSTMKQYENRFTTVGTVRQIPDAYAQTMVWNAEKEDYDVIKVPQYSSYRTVDDLQIPGVEYLAGPEQRAFYHSYTPEYLKLWRSHNPYDSASRGFLIAEFSPYEDCLPNESVKIKITKVIGGDKKMEGAALWFCDHQNPKPEMLYKDKTYVAMLNRYLFIHGSAYDEIQSSSGEAYTGLEYIPADLASDIMLLDGGRPEDPFRDGKQIFQVTKDFYKTDAGNRLLSLSQLIGYWQYCQPLTGTNRTSLLMPFYNGEAYICEGRDITEEEYAKGSKVCLAPKIFMENNGLVLGDSIKTALLCTDTARCAGDMFWLDGSVGGYGGMIDEKGNPLTVFENSDYTVVGIYDVVAGNKESIYAMGADELIVPMESIKERNGKNLMACGAMRDETSSFQIPNGSIDAFLKEWTVSGIENMEFTFYDKGYSQLKAGIDNMRNLSFVLLAAGVILTGLLLFFFSHLFITKQAERTAIERSFGMRKAQCRWSILSGFVLLVLLGSIIGSATGAKLSNQFSVENARETYYDMAYTVGTTNNANKIELEEAEAGESSLPSVFCTILVVVAGTGIAWAKMNRSLRREPMQLLSERREV